MQLRNLFAALIVLVGSAYAVNASSPNTTGQRKVEEFIWFGTKFFESIKSKPIKRKIEKIKNPHVGNQLDEWHTETYAGFRVEFLRSKTAPGDLLSSLSITDPAIKLPFGITIGITSAQVIRVLGNPSNKKGSELEYEAGDVQTASVYFRFANDRLHEVKWSYEID